jgi:cytoskeletal protein CcmA (bactofilin family)
MMLTRHSPASARRFGLVLIWLLTAFASLSGYQYKKGNDLYITDDYQEDLFLWGATVNFDGTIAGDIITGGKTVTINGTVDGSVIAGCQRLTINGEICRSLRCFAQTLNITSPVDGDVVAFVADMTLGNEAVIGGDLAVFSGDVFIDGKVNGRTYISGGTVTIAGQILGDVTIKAEKISITPDAVIGGELNYTSKTKASIAPDAKIAGDVKWKKKSSETSESSGMIPRPVGAFWSLIFLGGSLLLGITLILIKRNRVVAITEEIKRNAAVDGLIGIAVIVVIPVLLILIAVSLVGIPVAAAGLAVYLLVFLVAKVLVGITIGLLALRLLKKEGRISLGWALLVGMILLAISYKIPILGWLVYFAAWAVGAGALTMLLFRKKSTASPIA